VALAQFCPCRPVLFLPSCSPVKSVALASPLPLVSIFDRAAHPYSFSHSPHQPSPSDRHPPLTAETDLEFKSSTWESLFPFDYLQRILTVSAMKSSGGWIMFTPKILDRKPPIYRSSMSRFHGKTESKPYLAASTSLSRHRPSHANPSLLRSSTHCAASVLPVPIAGRPPPRSISVAEDRDNNLTAARPTLVAPAAQTPAR
jgi:hypothetical protein